MKKQNYIVATIKPWNIRTFHAIVSKLPGRWRLITDRKKLTPELLARLKPRYVFFPHWSWIVPSDILSLAECVCFHETDLPYGRGGSPIQNLIARGHKTTMISAIRMEAGLDTGPVYLKRRVSLAGSAQEIFERNAVVVAGMIKTMIARKPVPKPQKGRPVIFSRRKPEQSALLSLSNPTLKMLYDHIRMLDAETYPRAFVSAPQFRLELSTAKWIKGKLVCQAKITVE